MSPQITPSWMFINIFSSKANNLIVEALDDSLGVFVRVDKSCCISKAIYGNAK